MINERAASWIAANQQRASCCVFHSSGGSTYTRWHCTQAGREGAARADPDPGTGIGLGWLRPETGRLYWTQWDYELHQPRPCQSLLVVVIATITWPFRPVWARDSPPYPFTSPPFTLSLVSFTFSLIFFLLASSVFLLFHLFPFYQNSPALFSGRIS